MKKKSPVRETRTFLDIRFECRAALHILAHAFADAYPPFPLLTEVSANVMQDGYGRPLGTVRLVVNLADSNISALTVYRVMALLDARIRHTAIDERIHWFESDLDLSDATPFTLERRVVERCLALIFHLQIQSIPPPEIERRSEVRAPDGWLPEGEWLLREALAELFESRGVRMEALPPARTKYVH